MRFPRAWLGPILIGALAFAIALVGSSCGSDPAAVTTGTNGVTGELSVCPNGSDGAAFSLSGTGDGAPTPEEAIAAGTSFPDGTPTDGYQLVDTQAVVTSPGSGQRLYANVDGNRLVAVVSVVPLGSGWAVDSVANCH